MNTQQHTSLGIGNEKAHQISCI